MSAPSTSRKKRSKKTQWRASSAICEARKIRWSSVGAAIANGSSSVVTRSSPMKNCERPNIMNRFSSASQVLPSFHSSASRVKSNASEFQPWFSQREISFL